MKETGRYTKEPDFSKNKWLLTTKEPDFSKRPRTTLWSLKTNLWGATLDSQSNKRLNCRLSLSKPPNILFQWKKKFINLTKSPLSSWSNWKMPRLRSPPFSNTSLTWSRGSQFTFQLKMIKLIANWPNSSTITLRGLNWRSCSWGSLKVCTRLGLKEWLLRLRSRASRSELAEATCLLMSSWISTRRSSLKNLAGMIRLRGSVRRSLFKKLLLMLGLESPRLLEMHLLEDLRLLFDTFRFVKSWVCQKSRIIG